MIDRAKYFNGMSRKMCLLLLSGLGLLQGCEGCGNDTPDARPGDSVIASPPVTDSAVISVVPPKEFDTTAIMGQLRNLDSSANVDLCTIDTQFVADGRQYAIITRNGSYGHYNYLVLCRDGIVEKCAEIESVQRVDDALPYYSYRDCSWDDTICRILVHTQQVTDSNLIENGRLRLPNTLSVLSPAFDSVKDELYPSMLLHDSIKALPYIWKPVPPFSNKML
jgi:hypothetical protein